MDMTSELDESVEHNPAEGSHVEDGVVEHPTADDFGHARALPADRTWFKRAVFYEVLVRAFYDSSSDGSGDLRGLIERLDYLQWLGVDCLWLPPFYDSPLRDGGYDIRDFYRVLPSSARSTTSSPCSTRRTSAASGSSPTWS
jgi:maltose alpha-D-glucosyltransferase/alpha-amylase